jgi:hypothetical protein
MEYHLYPPFFVIEPQTSFSKAWEDFCRRLLSLEWRTTAIHRRIPPDRGIDLFWQAEGLAYQCKAVESGFTGDFQTAHVKTSIKKAQEYQTQIGWRKYALCTNVDLTGPKTETLQQMLPDIEILPAGYWTDLCQRFHEQIADRFRLLIPVAPVHVQRATQAINQIYLRNYLPQMQEYTQTPLLNMLLYLDSYKHIFDIPIPSTFTAHEVLLMLRELFELPGPKYIREHNTTVSLEYSLHIDNKEVPAQQKLGELQVNDRPLVTLCKTIIWSDNGHKTQTTDLESSFKEPIPRLKTPLHGPERSAVEQYTQEIGRAIDQAIMRFSMR